MGSNASEMNFHHENLNGGLSVGLMTLEKFADTRRHRFDVCGRNCNDDLGLASINIASDGFEFKTARRGLFSSVLGVLQHADRSAQKP